MIKKASILSFSFILLGCTSLSIDGNNYAETQPHFNIEKFFVGNVKAWGIVQNRSGDVIQRFTVKINGSKKNNQIILDEKFTYGVGDGPESRVWTITKQDDGVYSGSASDILGEATGRSYGNAFNLNYSMNLPVGDSSYEVNFDDWIWAFDKNTIMNRSYITKFGITFAEVTIFMQKQKQ